ncbi:MAG: hypothetical protein E6Q97_12825 [Desulfurellales bacterium]|nr:MAG: hypothetical protein E6Q97_12825 [Desulfurellales bacterium]
MNNTANTKITDQLMEWLVYAWPHQFVHVGLIQQGTGLTRRQIASAVRTLAASYGVLEYTKPGEYRIVDLERYFDEPEAGCYQRYHEPQLYK